LRAALSSGDWPRFILWGMATTATIQVLLCDDHALVRSGVRRLLEAEASFEVVGEASDAEEAVAFVGEQQPDVLLLDIVMPGRNGIEAIPDLIAASPETRILVLSMQDDPSYVRQAFAGGANGYLLKEAADAELVQAIRAVASGQRYVHPALGARLAAAEANVHEGAAADPLSDREHEVLRLLALGNTNLEIAKQLFISVRTAETHRARIMQKLRLSSRAELVRYALATGALELDRPAANSHLNSEAVEKRL
jgi:two-component system response regulator NreC